MILSKPKLSVGLKRKAEDTPSCFSYFKKFKVIELISSSYTKDVVDYELDFINLFDDLKVETKKNSTIEISRFLQVDPAIGDNKFENNEKLIQPKLNEYPVSSNERRLSINWYENING